MHAESECLRKMPHLVTWPLDLDMQKHTCPFSAHQRLFPSPAIPSESNKVMKLICHSGASFPQLTRGLRRSS